MTTWQETIEIWREPAHAERFSARVAQTDALALFWETSPSRTGEEPYEDRLLPARGLAHARPDPGPFVEHLVDPVNVFPNLRGDARLVCPGPPGDFAHLADFVRAAPPDLQHAFWVQLAEAIEGWWNDPAFGHLWVSTHGLGVFWLHVRLDAQPKYYLSELRHRTP